MSKINVIELFGPTIQGEGNNAGVQTIFVRTGGCDFRCAWCDSKNTWKRDPFYDTTPDDVLERVLSLAENTGVRHVTITGGNPALFSESMSQLIDLLHAEEFKVDLETQGSIYKAWMSKIDNLVVSPKPPSSTMRYKTFDAMFKITTFCENVTFKIPVFTDEDFEFANMIYNKFYDVIHSGAPFYLSVGNSDTTDYEAKGNHVVRMTPEINHKMGLLDKYKWLVEKTLKSNMSLARPLPQLHVLVWGNKKEV